MFQLICDMLIEKNYCWKKMRFLDFSLFFMFIVNSDIIYFLLECNNESFAHIGLIMLFINWE